MARMKSGGGEQLYSLMNSSLSTLSAPDTSLGATTALVYAAVDFRNQVMAFEGIFATACQHYISLWSTLHSIKIYQSDTVDMFLTTNVQFDECNKSTTDEFLLNFPWYDTSWNLEKSSWKIKVCKTISKVTGIY